MSGEGHASNLPADLELLRVVMDFIRGGIEYDRESDPFYRDDLDMIREHSYRLGYSSGLFKALHIVESVYDQRVPGRKVESSYGRTVARNEHDS